MTTRFSWTRASFWLLFFALVWMIFALVIPPAAAFQRTIVVFLFFGTIVWFNLQFLIPNFIERRRFIYYGIAASSSAVALALVRVMLERRLGIQLIPLFNPAAVMTERRDFFLVVVNHLTAVSAALLYHFASHWADSRRIEAQLKSEKLESELRFLKGQVSPHFLFNTLNNIYTLCYIKDDRAPQMVIKLSLLMRYIIDQGSHPYVPLTDEVNFLRSYLDLQKLRSSEFRKINFAVSGSLEQASIPPLLLLPFFENLFKHSDMETNPQGWANVSIAVAASRSVAMSAANSWATRARTAENRSGFGIENLRQRLALLYGDTYTLTMNKTPNTFEVQLTLPLK